VLKALATVDPSNSRPVAPLHAAFALEIAGNACASSRQQAVQLHGGMGMTEDLKASHLFKRLPAIEVTFGNSDTHLRRYAELTRSNGRATHV
jgi:alkylation response protein AidB-like acyl-CoA dehydrogenase